MGKVREKISNKASVAKPYPHWLVLVKQSYMVVFLALFVFSPLIINPYIVFFVLGLAIFEGLEAWAVLRVSTDLTIKINRIENAEFHYRDDFEYFHRHPGLRIYAKLTLMTLFSAAVLLIGQGTLLGPVFLFGYFSVTAIVSVIECVYSGSVFWRSGRIHHVDRREQLRYEENFHSLFFPYIKLPLRLLFSVQLVLAVLDLSIAGLAWVYFIPVLGAVTVGGTLVTLAAMNWLVVESGLIYWLEGYQLDKIESVVEKGETERLTLKSPRLGEAQERPASNVSSFLGAEDVKGNSHNTRGIKSISNKLVNNNAELNASQPKNFYFGQDVKEHEIHALLKQVYEKYIKEAEVKDLQEGNVFNEKNMQYRYQMDSPEQQKALAANFFDYLTRAKDNSFDPNDDEARKEVELKKGVLWSVNAKASDLLKELFAGVSLPFTQDKVDQCKQSLIKELEETDCVIQGLKRTVDHQAH